MVIILPLIAIMVMIINFNERWCVLRGYEKLLTMLYSEKLQRELSLKEVLYYLYIEKGLSTQQIADMHGISYMKVYTLLKENDIPKRNKNERREIKIG